MPSTWLSEVSPARTPSRPGEYSRSSAGVRRLWPRSGVGHGSMVADRRCGSAVRQSDLLAALRMSRMTRAPKTATTTAAMKP